MNTVEETRKKMRIYGAVGFAVVLVGGFFLGTSADMLGIVIGGAALLVGLAVVYLAYRRIKSLEG